MEPAAHKRAPCVTCYACTRAAPALQNLHAQQLDDRKLLSSQVGQVEDMYESLAAHEQKVPTADQVKHDDLTEAMAAFQAQLTAGLEFIADHKEEQCGVLLASVRALNEELQGIADGCHTGAARDRLQLGRSSSAGTTPAASSSTHSRAGAQQSTRCTHAGRSPLHARTRSLAA